MLGAADFVCGRPDPECPSPDGPEPMIKCRTSRVCARSRMRIRDLCQCRYRKKGGGTRAIRGREDQSRSAKGLSE